MTNDILHIFGRDPNKVWSRALFIIAGITIAILGYNQFTKLDPLLSEGFVQTAPFVTKMNLDIYDDFYVELYDKINKPEVQTQFIIKKVIDMTMPSKEKSVFLDIGSGTGVLTNAIKQKGYTIYGIDIAHSMVEYCAEKYPKIPIKCGDVLAPMMYDRNTFSHVLCTNMTIYHFQDKKDFFRKCYFMMKPNSYMILHLVDRSKFDPIIQGGKPEGIASPQQYSDRRITDTAIDFLDFKYKASYDLSKTNGETILVETMTDNVSHHVRQNELTLYMEDYNMILKCAQANGFIVHGQVNMLECIGDEHQYIFVLERTL
jgi:2-polyprenyl-3-methyl-5-hydroxy-6-metoxy-1,4-benzoquinol methylase